MTRVAVTGAAGRMGKTLVAAVQEHPGLTLGAAIERPDVPSIGQDVGDVAGIGTIGITISDSIDAVADDFDVLIDFTVADASEQNVAACRRLGKHMVIGTTGMSDAQKSAITAAGAEIPIVFAPNYSVGVNVTFKLAEIAASIFGDEVDIEIMESHHRHKVDAPSGTALGLGETVAAALHRKLSEVSVHGRQGITGERQRRTIGFHAIRAGDIVGEHTVLFAGAGERVEITHRSQTRLNFAQGALRAAAWIAEKTAGVYDMQDVLGLKHVGDVIHNAK